MKNKGLLIIGVLAIAGIGYYLYTRSNNASVDGDLGTGAQDGANQTKSANAPLTTRKDKKRACGRKPLINKAKKEAWQQCVNAGGVASFDGDYGL